MKRDLTVEDEGPHPHGPEQNWQESAVITWGDPVTGLGGHHRVSFQPNLGRSQIWCGLYHHRDTIFRINEEVGEIVPVAEGRHGFGYGPQYIVSDGTDLHLEINHPDCTADLIFDDFKSSVEKFDDEGGMAAVIYRSHFNFHGTVSGTVVLGGERFEVKKALAWRDHSWGPRNWGDSLVHRSLHGNFGEDFNFHLLTVLTHGGRLDRRGHLVRKGKAVSFDSFTIRIEMLEDGVTPVRGTAHIFLPDGEKLRFSCDVQKGVFGTVESLTAFFGSGPCYRDGSDEVGFCDFEVGSNPRAGTAPVGLAIGNTLRNGLYKADVEPWKYEPL